jgi:hypothetical protein
MDIENIDTKVPSVPPLELLAVPARTPDPEIMIEVGGQISLDGTQCKLFFEYIHIAYIILFSAYIK